MAERSDVSTDWSESPRIIEVASPSQAITIQDLHDTCRSDTKQPGEGGDNLENMDDDAIIDSAGKEDLGGGILVGITATLQNAQLAFESRLTPTSEGSVTTANAAGTSLIDNTATFQTDGVERGATIVNFTDESVTEVLEVISETEIRCRVLRAGTDNDFDLNDSYKIWNIVQCDIEGGNLVATDDLGGDLSPVFPTAFTQIVRTASSSATLQEQEDIQYASFGGAIHVDVTNGAAGVTFPNGTERQPVNNFVDALSIAATRGLEVFEIDDVNPVVIPAGLDFTGFRFRGESSAGTTVIVQSGATVTNTDYENLTITNSVLTGTNTLRDCLVLDVTMAAGGIVESALQGTLTISGGIPGTSQLGIVNCVSNVPGSDTPVVDIGSGTKILVRNYSGGIEFQNKTGSDAMSVDMNSGQVIINDNMVAGTVTLRGVAKWTNESTYAGTTTVNDELLKSRQLQELYTLLGLKEGDSVTITPSGVTTSQGSFTITFTGDGINTTTQERTA